MTENIKVLMKCQYQRFGTVLCEDSREVKARQWKEDRKTVEDVVWKTFISMDM